MRLFARRQAAPTPPPPAAAAEPSAGGKTRDESQFTEADILTILRTAAQGSTPEELCTAEGISLKTFESWKAKYDGLTVSQIKVRRRREQTSRRNVVVLSGLVIVASAGWYAFTVSGAPPAQLPPQAKPKPAATPAAATSKPAPVPAPAASPVPAANAAASSGAAPAAAAPIATLPPGPAPKSAAAAPTAAPSTAKPSTPAASTPATSTAAAPKPASPSSAATPAAAPAAMPAAPVAAPAAKIVAEDLKGHSIQVAAVPTVDEAKAMTAELGRGGYPTYITRMTKGNGEVLYRVRVGPFESKDATKVIADRLEQSGYRGAWLVSK